MKLAFSVSVAGCIAPSLSTRKVKSAASLGMHTEESQTPNEVDWKHEDYVAGAHEPCLMHGGIVLQCASGYSCHRGFHGLYTCEEPLPPPTLPPADGTPPPSGGKGGDTPEEPLPSPTLPPTDGTPPPNGGKGGDTPEDGIELAEVSLSTESNTSNLQFVMGPYGSTGCPSGSRASTLTECGQARSFYGKSGVSQENTYDSAPGCMYYSYDNRIWYNYQVRASGYRMCRPICVKESSGFGLTPTQFNDWMKYWQTQSIAMGGYVCAASNGWCSCSCGNNQGVNCYLPPMQPGTTGGHTCGYYGVLYGCAEGHNTISGCPVGSGGTPLSGKGDGTFTGKGV